MTRCKRCSHALDVEKRDIHWCKRLWIITYAASAVACGITLEAALWDEQRWLNKAGLLPDVPWSAT